MSLRVGSHPRFARGNDTRVLQRGRGLCSSSGPAICSSSRARLRFSPFPTRCRQHLANTSMHVSALTRPSTKPFPSPLHVRQAHYCSGLRRQRMTEAKQRKFCIIWVFSCCSGGHGPCIAALSSNFFLCRDLWGGGKMLQVLGQSERRQQKCIFGSFAGWILLRCCCF